MNLVIALARRCHATSPDAPTKYRELRGSVVMQECFRDNHTTHIVRLVVPPTLILFGPTSPRAAGPFVPELRSDNVALCAIPRLHCHADCTAVPSGRATARVAAIIAPVCRHPSRQLRRSAVLEVWSGRLSPKLPPPIPPDARSPFRPQGGDCARFKTRHVNRTVIKSNANKLNNH